MQVGLLGGLRPARVDDDQRAAVLPQFGEVAQGRRHRLRRVRPDEDHAPGPRNVLQRERQPPVEPERPGPGRRRRRHAEPPVVVDLRGAQHHPGELAQRVRLLVGQPAPAEHPERVRAVLRPRAPQVPGDPVQRLVPAGRRQRPVGGPHQRRGQPRPGREHLCRRPPLAAQRAPVHGEVRTVGHLDGPALDGRQVHPALQGAVRAVRGGGGGVPRAGALHTGQPAAFVLRDRAALCYAAGTATSPPPSGHREGRLIPAHPASASARATPGSRGPRKCGSGSKAASSAALPAARISRAPP